MYGEMKGVERVCSCSTVGGMMGKLYTRLPVGKIGVLSNIYVVAS